MFNTLENVAASPNHFFNDDKASPIPEYFRRSSISNVDMSDNDLENMDIEQQLRMYKEAFTKSNRRCEELKLEVASLRKPTVVRVHELEEYALTLRQQIEDNLLKKHINEKKFRNQVGKYESEIIKLKEDLDHLKSNLDQSRTIRHKLENDIENIKDKLKIVTNKRAKEKKTLIKNKQTNKELRTKLDISESERESFRQQLSESNRKFQTIRAASTSLNDKVVEEPNNLAIKKQLIESLANANNSRFTLTGSSSQTSFRLPSHVSVSRTTSPLRSELGNTTNISNKSHIPSDSPVQPCRNSSPSTGRPSSPSSFTLLEDKAKPTMIFNENSFRRPQSAEVGTRHRQLIHVQQLDSVCRRCENHNHHAHVHTTHTERKVEVADQVFLNKELLDFTKLKTANICHFTTEWHRANGGYKCAVGCHFVPDANLDSVRLEL